MRRWGVMGDRGRGVEEIVLEKLKTDKVPESVANLIITAMRGGAALEYEQEPPPPDGEPRLSYLKGITAAGFRGIGPKITLPLQPGPGLTLITGRNGSGKSSLAEAAELALTGQNRRWTDRAAVWREGWRNFHEPEPAAIEVDMTEDGQHSSTIVTMRWAANADLGEADVFFMADGTPHRLADKGWSKPLELYRPFLSYSELGALVSGHPSKMHDALQAILGLDLLIDTERALTDSRKAADSASKAATKELPALLGKLANHS